MTARRDSGGPDVLDRQALESYERDGFFVRDGFFAPETCERVIARSLQIVDELASQAAPTAFSTRLQTETADRHFLTSGDKVRLFYDDGAFGPDGRLLRPYRQAVNKIGHALHDLDPFFSTISRDPRLAAIARDVGLRRPLLLQSTVIFKQARTGGEVVSHQDSMYLYTDPPSCTGFWFALEDAGIENGCLWVLPGGHTGPLAARYRRTADGAVRFDPTDPPAFDEARFVPLPAKKGALIVLHGLLPHRSGANRSPDSRHAFTLHVIDGICRYPADNWLVRGPDMPLRGFAGANVP